MNNVLTQQGWNYSRNPDFSSGTYEKAVDQRRVRAWYDVHTKQWIVYEIDAQGCQIGAADYCYSATDVDYTANCIVHAKRCDACGSWGKPGQSCGCFDNHCQ